MLSEERIIETLRSSFPSHIGDDASVLPISDTESYVITKDLLAEEVHFCLRYETPATIARKAVAVNISDICAMGATPKYVMLGIAIPPEYSSFIEAFLPAFAESCKAYNVTLIGGDTIRSSSKLAISITALGTGVNLHIKLRSHAQVGDIIFVAGNLGHADRGLKALQNNIAGLNEFKQAFLEPKALVAEGLWFGQQPHVHAMMDVSDGLFIDLQRLCKESNVGAEIELSTLAPASEIEHALVGGEDYGLMITVNASQSDTFQSEFTKRFRYQLKTIGKITHGNQVKLMRDSKESPLTHQPFSHFNQDRK
jgi:thiamine-monophosphate kinase